MIDSIQELNRKIEVLISYIVSNRNIKVFINDVKKEQGNFQQYALWLEFNNLDSRIFEYKSYIISLYGCFEKYIESVLSEYINNVCCLHLKYNDLPEDIILNNLKKNAELLNVLDYPKNRNLDEKILISNLNDNLNNKVPLINTDAFCQHSSNFRIVSIGEYFKSVGLSSIGKEISSYEPLKSALDEIHYDYARLELTKTYNVIDELAERRNIIAHGGDDTDILDSDEILKMCNFIHSFCNALNLYLFDKILERIIVSTNDKIIPNKYLLEPIAVYGERILCVNSNNLEVSIGSKILIERNVIPKFILSSIKSIQVNGNSVNEISSTESIDIGLELSDKIKNTNTFYLVDSISI